MEPKKFVDKEKRFELFVFLQKMIKLLKLFLKYQKLNSHFDRKSR